MRKATDKWAKSPREERRIRLLYAGQKFTQTDRQRPMMIARMVIGHRNRKNKKTGVHNNTENSVGQAA